MRRHWAIVAVLSSCLLTACSQQSATSTGDSSEKSGDAPQGLSVQLPQSSAQSPDRVVDAFLVALREGDDETAAALLTDVARQETAKHDLTVAPPGSPSAEFQIGAVEYVDSNHSGAHVNSIWTETDPSGGTISYKIVWALRRQVDGWRIAGLATEIIEGQAQVFLNFEDPSDMLAKWQHAQQVAAQHDDSQEVRQAQRGPSADSGTIPR